MPWGITVCGGRDQVGIVIVFIIHRNHHSIIVSIIISQNEIAVPDAVVSKISSGPNFQDWKRETHEPCFQSWAQQDGLPHFGDL